MYFKITRATNTIRIIFAPAPSQDAMLGYIAKPPHIKLHKIVTFNMDEYSGLPKDAVIRSGNFVIVLLNAFIHRAMSIFQG